MYSLVTLKSARNVWRTCQTCVFITIYNANGSEAKDCVNREASSINYATI